MSGAANIIERAARAVRDARALPGTKPVATLSDVDRRVARAVLQAIRDVDHGIIDAALDASPKEPE